MPELKQNAVTAQSFVSNLQTRIRDNCRWLEIQLTNASVVLRKRLRDLNDDDRTGAFAPEGVGGGWTTIDQSGIYSWNIVKRTIRANTSALITARVKLMAEPPSIKNTKAEMASQVSTALLEEFERTEWTRNLQEYIANEQQLGAGVFLQTKVNPYKKRFHNAPKWDKEETMEPGTAICAECGQTTAVVDEIVPDGAGMASVPCAMCGAEAVVETYPKPVEMDVQTGYEEFTTGTPETKAFPFWEFRVDEHGTQGGNIENARWFEHFYPASLDELQLEYPESAEAIQRQSDEWPYALRWQNILLSGQRTLSEFQIDRVVEMRVVRDLYLTPTMYLNHPVSEDFELKNADGKKRFCVKKGQTYDQGIFEGKPFKETPTLCFRVIGNEIIDVYPADFKKEFAYAGFLSSSSTFWALFATELIALQDIVNYMLTVQMYHIRRNAITSIIYNSQALDSESFGSDFIPSKNTLPFDVKVQDTFGVVPALQLQEPMQMLQATMSVQGEISSVQPAMVGEAQPNQPYAAQLLQKQQSLGLLSPASLSSAEAKVKMAKQYIRLRKELWTEEDTAGILLTYTDWTEEFIEAFLEADIDHDIHIDFMQGTEIPQSLVEREIKLRQTLQDLMALAPLGPELVSPETLNEILHEIMQAGGVELDVNNTENSLRIAEWRYDKLLSLVGNNPEKTDDPLWNQGVAAQILQAPEFQPMPFEKHKIIIEFYVEKSGQVLATAEPDYLVATCLVGMIRLQQDAEVQQAQRQLEMTIMAQAPAEQKMKEEQNQQMMAQQAAQQQQNEEQNSQGQQQAEMQREQQDIERQSIAEEREFAVDQRMIDEASKEADRELKREELKARNAKTSK